jgi:hypothetical protein
MSESENVPSQVADWLASQAVQIGRELAVTMVDAHVDCTVYGWATAEAASGSLNSKDLLAGNAPLILDRDGQLWTTGTAHPIETYVADLRGSRRLVKLVAERRRL